MITAEKSSIFERIREHKAGRYLYILPLAAAYFLLAYGFHTIYWPFAHFDAELARYPLCFDLGWTLLLTGITMLLPAITKKLFMLLGIVIYSLISIAGGVMLNLFGRFFSFSDLYFAGDGAAFMDISYLQIRKLAVALCLVCILLTVLACVLAPRRHKAYSGFSVVSALLLLAAGIALCLSVKSELLKNDGDFTWDAGLRPEANYEKYSDTVKSCLISGLYEYSFRDLYLTMGWFNKPTREEIASISEFADSRPAHAENEMSGIFAGKNLLLIQLESIDTWLITQEYMPNLYAVQQGSLCFENHFSPIYLSGGTFNTEFMANTSLFPALTGTPSSVYAENAFPNSLPALMERAGYTANSFHHSDGVIYDRANIHKNLGYERYVSYIEMQMEDTYLDTELMRGYGDMVGADKFFSFVITISGHGPFTEENSASVRHIDRAREVAQRSEPGYVQAIAQAMETDEFIGQLMAALDRDGLLDNTVLAFYADHYNYYLHDKALSMEIKGSPNENMLAHTSFFIYSRDTEPRQVNKVTTSLDILPTLANLFALDADYSLLLGADAFSDEGGCVFFPDGSWYDGALYRDSSTAETEEIRARDKALAEASRVGQLLLKCDYFAAEDG